MAQYCFEIVVVINTIVYMALTSLLSHRKRKVKELNGYLSSRDERIELLESDRTMMGRMLEDCEREKERLREEIRLAVKELDAARENEHGQD